MSLVHGAGPCWGFTYVVRWHYNASLVGLELPDRNLLVVLEAQSLQVRCRKQLGWSGLYDTTRYAIQHAGCAVLRVN